jgi:hypothetical protein
LIAHGSIMKGMIPIMIHVFRWQPVSPYPISG